MFEHLEGVGRDVRRAQHPADCLPAAFRKFLDVARELRHRVEPCVPAFQFYGHYLAVGVLREYVYASFSHVALLLEGREAFFDEVQVLHEEVA